MSLPWHLRDRYGDALLAAAIVALGLLQTLVDSDLTTAQTAANVTLAAALGVTLALRRRIPVLLLA